VVSALGDAVPAVSKHFAHHDLDGQHNPDLLRLAFTQDGASMAGSELDHVC